MTYNANSIPHCVQKMLYYIIIGQTKDENAQEHKSELGDSLTLIVRNDVYSRPRSSYSYSAHSEGAHCLFGYLDVNFLESPQYGQRATATQEAWLIGRHRIGRAVDFGNLGYQFVRQSRTKRIQFPDTIILSFDRKIKDNGLNLPPTDAHRVDVELTQLDQQILNCYDKPCVIEPIIFKLSKFDNYGDAYIDLLSPDNESMFYANIDHFVSFMRHYPNTSIYIMARRQMPLYSGYSSYRSHDSHSSGSNLKSFLKNLIQKEHLTNYFEFCDAGFERKYLDSVLSTRHIQSGMPYSEYDTFDNTIDEFFNQSAFDRDPSSQSRFYHLPFSRAKIVITSPSQWSMYQSSGNFILFLQHNPQITLDIEGTVLAEQVVLFIRHNRIKANIILLEDPHNALIKQAISDNQAPDLQQIITRYRYDHLEDIPVAEAENRDYRLTLAKYAPHLLRLSSHQSASLEDMHVGQNQNQNQNQNQSQQFRQNNNELFEPIKFEFNDKSSIPDVHFEQEGALLKSIIGLDFAHSSNMPQTETNINRILRIMHGIIEQSTASQACYCPLSYSVEELVPGAFYVPKDKVAHIPHPTDPAYNFQRDRNTLFFSPPYASIAIKKDKYAFKPYLRPCDDFPVAPDLIEEIRRNKYLTHLVSAYSDAQVPRISILLNKLYYKRGQIGVDLLTKGLYALHLKNPLAHQAILQHYLLSSEDFSEYLEANYMSTLEALSAITDLKKLQWWNTLLAIQCRNNPQFDVNHLWHQFVNFWDDLDKIQKFMPIPDQFPFADFADAGLTLGKMIRILSKARNRFEQIQKFEGGNISHAYMLFDLFNSSMYCKEMDAYCDVLMEELKAEDAFDKTQLKTKHFSTRKLLELTYDDSISLETLKSYYYIFAAVNGHTATHNNSDQAFYEALFQIIEQAISSEFVSASDAEKKLVYSTLLLFTAYGNNAPLERMAQDIHTLVQTQDFMETCTTTLQLYAPKPVSEFFSQSDAHGSMVNSEAMLSLHTVTRLKKFSPNYREILEQTIPVIIGHHPTVSLALQKIMREAPQRLVALGQLSRLIPTIHDPEKNHFIQSIALIAVLSNSTVNSHRFGSAVQQTARNLEPLSALSLQDLQRLFLDIDFIQTPQSPLFEGDTLSRSFVDQIRHTHSLDNLIFVCQDHKVKLATMKPSEQSLVSRIQFLAENLHIQVHKENYVANCKSLIGTKLQSKFKHTMDIRGFMENFIDPLQVTTGTDQELITIFTSLLHIIGTTKNSDLQLIMTSLQNFPSMGSHGHNPAQLLKVTALLLQHIYPIETVLSFLAAIQRESIANRQAKLSYVIQLFDKISQHPACFEERETHKLTPKITQQLKSGLSVIAAMPWSADSQRTWDSSFRATSPSILQYLRWLETLALPTNFSNEAAIQRVFELDQILFTVYGRSRHNTKAFDDILHIASFDATLLETVVSKHPNKIEVIARICQNEVLLNARKHDKLAENYRQIFADNMLDVLGKRYDVFPFYSEEQLAHPAMSMLVTLMTKYAGNVQKALHHFEKDPWGQRPHQISLDQKESWYETSAFDTRMQHDIIETLIAQYSGIVKSIRRNLLLSFATYINEKGYRLPALAHQNPSRSVAVPARKLSDKELKKEFINIKTTLAQLRAAGQNNIWQHRKYQRTVCNLLVNLRENMYRYAGKMPYSTQIDAILLAIFAGDYSYAMQINTGEGKAIIATVIGIAEHVITGKQLVITTSNLSLAFREGDSYHRLIQWLGLTHATLPATSKDKSKLNSQIIHTTGHDFALFHGKDHPIENGSRIYLDDEYDYTMSLLTPSINSQSKLNEEENWWIYETIFDYVVSMSHEEARKRSERQVDDLIQRLIEKYNTDIRAIEEECTHRLYEVRQNKASLSPEDQEATRSAIEKDCYARMDVYAKRVKTLEQTSTKTTFNRLINSAIIAQFVLQKGEAYEVIEELVDGKIFKKVVPTENGKPVIEGNMMYMYGIHQFLVQKEIVANDVSGDTADFIRPPELESTTYFNNYATHAGCKSIGMTGTVPRSQYKMHAAMVRGGQSAVIPPHNPSQRMDAVPFDQFHTIKIGSPHVCPSEADYIERAVQKIQAHDGPVLIYCRYKNICETRRNALAQRLEHQGYTVQMIIAGVTEDFTDGDKLTALGRQAQNQKTVTLTVGDGRGIDVDATGGDGMLTMPSFLPETPEKILQIYGRSGRNGKPGKTDLLILESDLTLYGIPFENMAKAFELIDEIRSKEFDFAIQKIGFLQYEIQRQIRDPKKRIALIAFMDDLYNQLLLNAVATKIKEERSNLVLDYSITGRWEPFVMLSDLDLNQIYQQFCVATQQKLQEEQLYTIQPNRIARLKAQYDANMDQAVRREQDAQCRIDWDYVRNRLQAHDSKQQRAVVGNTVVFEGKTLEICSREARQVYSQAIGNLSRYDKILSLIQKYLSFHLGIYGVVPNDRSNRAYHDIYGAFLRNEQNMVSSKQYDLQQFYTYLAYEAFLKAIDVCQNELFSAANLRSGNVSVRNRAQACFREARGYARMARMNPDVFRAINLQQLFDVYDVNKSSPGEVNIQIAKLRRERDYLNQKLREVTSVIQNREKDITAECLRGWDNLAGVLQHNLPQLVAMPLHRFNADLLYLFSMMQWATREERTTAPIRQVLSKFSNPNITIYNDQVTAYQTILYEQRECLVSLDRSPDLSQKLNQYKRMVDITDLSSKNLLTFFCADYAQLAQNIRGLSEAIKRETQQLQYLKEQLLCSNEQERRALYLKQTRHQIETAYRELRDEIEQLPHPSNNARQTLEQLLLDLNAEQRTYFSNLGSLFNRLELKQNFRGPDLQRINQDYIDACQRLIRDPATRSILAQDLNWGPYLDNWWRRLANILIMVVTLGCVSHFFKLTVPQTLIVLDQREESLQPVC